MGYFRKKPIVIEAFKCADLLRDARTAWAALPPLIKSEYERGNIVFGDGFASILTLEGRMQADESDWVLIGVKGEIYPCKPDIFEATYEAVSS